MPDFLYYYNPSYSDVQEIFFHANFQKRFFENFFPEDIPEISKKLKYFLLFEYKDADSNHYHTQDNHSGISVFQLGHITEIHAIPAERKSWKSLSETAYCCSVSRPPTCHLHCPFRMFWICDKYCGHGTVIQLFLMDFFQRFSQCQNHFVLPTPSALLYACCTKNSCEFSGASPDGRIL